MTSLLAIGIGTTELIILLVIVLIIFGAGKIPQVGEALGKGIKNFKRSAGGDDEVDITKKPAAELKPADEGVKAKADVADAAVVEKK